MNVQSIYLEAHARLGAVFERSVRRRYRRKPATPRPPERQFEPRTLKIVPRNLNQLPRVI